MVWVAAAVVMAALAAAVPDSDHKPPTVLVAVLVRNKADYLPLFLSRLAQLDYPKTRLALWLRADHCQDASLRIVAAWLAEHAGRYRHVDAVLNVTTPRLRDDESSPIDLSPSRYRAVIQLKEEALAAARRLWADFIWLLDADVMLHGDDVLRRLVGFQKPLVAPMLRSHTSYSNFWAGMDDEFYYRRTERYAPIYQRKDLGCFAVPMIHSCVLADLRLRWSDALTFVRDKMLTPTGPAADDVITFAISARQAGLDMFVCNQADFGQVPVPLEAPEVLSKEQLNVVNIKLEAMVDGPPLPLEPVMAPFAVPPPPPDRLGFDRVYMIGLARRPDRRRRMLASLAELGVDAHVVDAVDGRQLNATYLRERGVAMLPDYLDPINHRQLTYGEIGCFLSHYGVWQDVLARRLQRVVVFEDDVRFSAYFRYRLEQLMAEVERLSLDWDLIYLGRKIMQSDERWVDDSNLLVWPSYTYWTLAYVLSASGAEKLVREQPLKKMVAVDEYLPIMFGQHTNEAWSAHFSDRTLRALSASPLLVHPIKYTGEPGYVSDTEDALTIGADASCSADGGCPLPAR